MNKKTNIDLVNAYKANSSAPNATAFVGKAVYVYSSDEDGNIDDIMMIPNHRGAEVVRFLWDNGNHHEFAYHEPAVDVWQALTRGDSKPTDIPVTR